MIKDLSKDYNLRGYSMEYVARILLRRRNNNNFTFNSFRFTNLDELVNKYRLKLESLNKSLIDYVNCNWRCFDIIEFVLDNKKDRNVQNLIFYDVKTKWHKVDRDYFESCQSNHKFMTEVKNRFGIRTYIISIVLFENWRFSFNICNYSQNYIRTYTNYKILNKFINN